MPCDSDHPEHKAFYALPRGIQDEFNARMNRAQYLAELEGDAVPFAAAPRFFKKAPMNPGIVKTVEQLQAWGFKTTDSGDGETHDYECDLAIPYVHMETVPTSLTSEADRLRVLLASNGVVVTTCNEAGTSPHISASYCPVDGVAVLSLFNVVLK